MKLGDLTIVGGVPSARLMKALAVIAADLHPAYDRERLIEPGKSKVSCVLSSLTVRDFLWKVGFKDAAVAPVYFMIQAERDGKVLHSLGVGDHEAIGQPTTSPDTRRNWSGHMVALADGWLIDPTLYQVNRPQWSHMPGMIAVKLEEPGWLEPILNHRPLVGAQAIQDEALIKMLWLDQPSNQRWRTGGGDYRKERRVNVVRQLAQLHREGIWKEGIA